MAKNNRRAAASLLTPDWSSSKLGLRFEWSAALPPFKMVDGTLLAFAAAALFLSALLQASVRSTSCKRNLNYKSFTLIGIELN